MPAARKLKVYRTAIGFHDAYVATPSQKAALEAWGTDANLFARGMVELVDDPALTAEPLARPGEVVKRLRGSAEEQIAALPPDPPRPAEPAGKKGGAKPAPAGKPAKPKPRPSRAALDAAEAALAAAADRREAEDEAISARIRDLERERAALRDKAEREMAGLEKKRAAAERTYRTAMERWRR